MHQTAADRQTRLKVTLNVRSPIMNGTRGRLVVALHAMLESLGSKCGTTDLTGVWQFGNARRTKVKVKLSCSRYFEDEMGPIMQSIDFYVKQIAEMIGIDPGEVTVSYDWGVEGTPTPPCPKPKEIKIDISFSSWKNLTS